MFPSKTADDLDDRQVLLRFMAAGVCGSDLPAFRGVRGKIAGDTGAERRRDGGLSDPRDRRRSDREPSSARHRVGDRVVGWASGFDGLMERVVADGDGLAPYDPALSPQHAVALQPLACVLYAARATGRPQGAPCRRHRPGLDRVAVLLCRKGVGCRATSPVSTPSTATRVGKEFGVDTIVRATSDRWVSHLDPGRPARHRHRGRRPPGRHPRSRRRGHGAGRHSLLLRGARRRQLPDQHAHHAAQQPDAEIRRDARPAASSRCRQRIRRRSSRAARRLRHPHLRHRRGADRRSTWPAGLHRERVKIAIAE